MNPNFPSRTDQKKAEGFTLIEMLAVMAIVGVIIGLSVPAIQGLSKGQGLTAAGRQMLDDINSARQRAINNRSHVFVLFVPPDISQNTDITNLYGGEFSEYIFFTESQVGDQPGVGHPSFMGKWKKLPEKTFIAREKYSLTETNNGNIYARSFQRKDFSFPNALFPRHVGDLVIKDMPYLEFNSKGQLVSEGSQDAVIPLTTGSLFQNPKPAGGYDLPTFTEVPLGNYTNNPTRIRVDWLTGKARIERLEVQ